MHGARVDERDDDDREHVVRDDHCEHEGPETIREARPDEGEQTERECGVGRHRLPQPWAEE